MKTLSRDALTALTLAALWLAGPALGFAWAVLSQ